MIVMYVKLKNICAFDDFHANFSYPKKIENICRDFQISDIRKLIYLWVLMQVEKPLLGKC